MEPKYILGIIGVCCITAIECVALVRGVNGTGLSLAVGAICTMVAGVVGYTVAKKT